MGSIRKTPAGKWQARYRDPAGRVRGRTFRTKEAARSFIRKAEESREAGTWTDPTKGRTRFREWAEIWTKTTTHLRPSTIARNQTYMRTHLIPAWGDAPLISISQLDVRNWIAELSAKGLAPATVHRCYQLLSMIMRFAVDAGRIPISPCRNISLPRIERREMRHLTPGEVRALAEAIDPRYRALIYLAGYGGLRFGELAGLRWSRVDLDAGHVEVIEILTDVKGHIAFGPPKTRAGHRIVTIPPVVVNELRAHKEQWATDRSDLVFTSPQGAPLRNSLFRRRSFDPAVEKSELEPLRPHDLRHTAISLWIAAGGNPKTIAVRAGHTSVSVVLDRYGHLLPNADEPLLAELDRMASGQDGPSNRNEESPN